MYYDFSRNLVLHDQKFFYLVIRKMKDKTKAKKSDKKSKEITEQLFLDKLGKVFTVVGDKKDDVARVIKVAIGQGWVYIG